MKKNIYKRAVALLIAVFMLLSMTACGGDFDDGTGVGENGGKRVLIKVWNSGQGTAYLDKMIEVFNAKQSEWYVEYTASASTEAILSAFGLEMDDPTDLYMAIECNKTEFMEPLEGLLDETADGDTIPLKEKFFESYLMTEQAEDGHIYTLTGGGGPIGIVYNKELFEKAGIKNVPRTTDELAKVCNQLAAKEITPFIHFSGGGYWIYFLEAWRAQYDGYDYWLNNWNTCTDLEGNSPSKTVFTTKDGRYYMLAALQKLLTPGYVVNGSNSMDHTTAQTMFLNSDTAMMVNGSWLSNEVSGIGTVENYGVMKTPVISSIVNKLTSVKTDMALRDLIDAIDAVTDGVASEETYRSGDHYVVNGVEITAADWEYVASARNILTTCYDGNGNFIPNYSDAKEGAKEFLKFYYSDEGLKIFAETVKVSLPLKLSSGEIDTTNWNGFEQRMYELLFLADNFVCRQAQNIHPIYKYGGASAFGDVNYIVAFTSQNTNQRKTADELWEMVLQDMEEQYDSWIKNIE